MRRATLVLGAVFLVTTAACGSDTSTDSDIRGGTTESSTANADVPATDFPATLGVPADGYRSVVDLAARVAGEARTTYAVEQNGTIRLVDDGGRPGALMADLSSLTNERGEQGLLGLAFSPDGDTAYVNYTDLGGTTTVDAISVGENGTFDMTTRRTIYTLDQPYRNHNGGDLIVSPDGRYLFVFNGDGGSADDPERRALDPTSQLGKIVRIDLSSEGEPSAAVWASGLRNPWRAYLDPTTNELWIADVGQNEWEEVNVVPFDRSEGASFGWSAFEGTVEFNEDQLAIHETYDEVVPILTYPHENEDCSISGGAVYHGDSIDASGTWYVFSDFCSGNVRALCVTEERTSCGTVSLGRVESSVAVLPDAQGELWVLSLSGRLVPIVAAS